MHYLYLYNHRRIYYHSEILQIIHQILETIYQGSRGLALLVVKSECNSSSCRVVWYFLAGSLVVLLRQLKLVRTLHPNSIVTHDSLI